MNDNSQGNDLGRNLGPVIGFAAGALVGGLLGLLLAPASGEKTRRRIGETARRMGSDAGHAVDQARSTVTDAATGLGSDVKNAIDAGREAFRHDGERAASRIAQIINPPTSHTP
jgi:gas vesicle protein